MADLFRDVINRTRAANLAGAMRGKFEPAATVYDAAAAGARQVEMEGRLYRGANSQKSGALSVFNGGRPAAALYVPRWGSAATAAATTGGPTQTIQPPIPYATIVVAAANSMHPYAANADYTCDGEADQEEINAAIRAAANFTDVAFMHGGRVLLLDGEFRINDSITWPNDADESTLAGLGWQSSKIVWDDAATAGGDMLYFSSTSATYDCICDLWFSHSTSAAAGRNIYAAFGSSIEIRNCFFEAAPGDAIRFDSADTIMLMDCYFSSAGSAALSVGDLTYWLAAERNYIQTGTGIYIGGTSAFWSATITARIANNYISSVDDGISVGQEYHFEDLIIANNSINSTGVAINLKDGSKVQIAGNTISESQNYGIQAQSCAHLVITGNQIHNTHYDAITLIDCTDTLVTSNLIRTANAYAGTYAAIRLAGTTGSTGNTIVANRISDNSQTYAVIIEAGSDNNALLINDARGAYVTAFLSDAASGTVNTGNLT